MMKPVFLRVFLILAGLVLTISSTAQQLTFDRAMQLAYQHASKTPAAADMRRASAAIDEARSYYLPQVVVGSGLGKSFGYPMSIEGAAPAAFQLNYESYLYNPAQKEFIHSAKQAWLGSEATMRDQRDSLLLETALDYMQLDSYSSRLNLLQGQQQDAEQLVQIVTQRVQAGVQNDIELTRAKLQAAQVRMRAAQTAGAADVLRERLSQLTGLTRDAIVTLTESIPQIPDLSTEPGVVADALKNNPAIEAATKQAESQTLKAKGEHRAMLPSMDIVADYGYFTRYNNYDLYFSRFQHNNATIGVAIKFPFLNFPQRARAEQADADAVKADRQVQVAKDQVSAQTLQLARSVQQLAAAEEVAKLDYQLAQAEQQAIQTRVETAAPGAQGQPAPGPRDVQAAKLQSGDKYSIYLDASFALEKAKLELLRATGKLDSWVTAKSTP